MLLGCHLPTQGAVATREALLRFAGRAEALQMASLWVSDHVVFPRKNTGRYPGGRFPHAPDTPYLEPVAVLAAAAVCTSRARLGASVFILGHRNPVVMAKMLTTIDTLSGGRLICGVGVGWWQEEFDALGVPFGDRGKRADEVLAVFKALWTMDNPSFQGEHYRFADIGFAPKPVQKPHPPIWVGGDSPGAFRRVATLGDGWHATSKSPAELAAALPRLRAAAEAAGRAPESIELSIRFVLRPEANERGSRQALVDELAGYKALGLSHVVLDFRRNDLEEMLDVLELVATEIRPAVARA
ncbi:MAG: TIGR03619 family F420-dependent LLM class oxidoreductase [Candidatus Rokuibacteriota bacterium]